MRVSRRRLVSLAALAALAPWGGGASAQTVKIVQGRILPFEGLGVVPKSAADPAPAKGSNTIALYAAAFLGAPGTIGDMPPGEKVQFHYVTLHMLFSAAALPQPRSAEIKTAGNLQRLNGHVTIVPLDTGMRPITTLSALEVLATFPDTILIASSGPDTGSTKVGRAAFSAATHTLVPELAMGATVGRRVGTMIASFTQLYHHPSARTQVAYASDQREFGWMWYEHADDVIEGTHRTTAALEVAPSVRYLDIRIRIVADWRSHGAWQRDMEIVLDLAAGTPP